MRSLLVLPILVLSACGDNSSGSHDLSASTPDLARGPDLAPNLDLTPSPDLTCATRVLFQGGVDAAKQGWSAITQPVVTVNLSPGITEIVTSTTPRASSGGMLLYSRSLGLPAGKGFIVEVALKVLKLVNHDQYDAAVAIMGSYNPGSVFGTNLDRSQMLYIDSNAIGWGDNSANHAQPIDGAFHTYRLAIDDKGNATASRDGVVMVTRAGFRTTGVIAFGDQTNEPGVDATMQIESVSLLCP